MRDPPGDEHMIDPVISATAAAAATPHLQLVAPSTATPSEPTSSTAAGGAAASTASGQPATRVYVDRSDSGVYVYQLVDVSTGQVLVELPREASQSLKVMDGYTPGAVAAESA